MHFSSLLIIAAVAVSAAARVAVPAGDSYTIDPRDINGAMVEGLSANKVMFPGSDSDSDSGGETSIEDDPRFSMAASGDSQLDRLGALTDAQRTAIENEHKMIIKEQMAKFDATNAKIEKLAHGKGSKDPNIHITATLMGLRQNKQGAKTKIQLPSTFGAGEKGNFFHIYVNSANPADGLSVVKAKMPEYYAALQRKQGKKPSEAPEV